MNEDDKTISEQSENIHDEFQCPSANPKVAESAEAVENLNDHFKTGH